MHVWLRANWMGNQEGGTYRPPNCHCRIVAGPGFYPGTPGGWGLISPICSGDAGATGTGLGQRTGVPPHRNSRSTGPGQAKSGDFGHKAVAIPSQALGNSPWLQRDARARPHRRLALPTPLPGTPTATQEPCLLRLTVAPGSPMHLLILDLPRFGFASGIRLIH